MEAELSMSERRYGHADEKYDVELERLTIQASMIDPATIRHRARSLSLLFFVMERTGLFDRSGE